MSLVCRAQPNGKPCESVSLSVCQKLTGLVKNGLSSRVLRVQVSCLGGPAGRVHNIPGRYQVDVKSVCVNISFDVNGTVAYIGAGFVGQAPCLFDQP